jgi:hypothetical protein
MSLLIARRVHEILLILIRRFLVFALSSPTIHRLGRPGTISSAAPEWPGDLLLKLELDSTQFSKITEAQCAMESC